MGGHQHLPPPITHYIMATRMTENGVSTTQKGQEQYETFVISTRPKRTAVQYDYRSAEAGEFLDEPPPQKKKSDNTNTFCGGYTFCSMSPLLTTRRK